MPSVFPPISADTIPELATRLGLPPDRVSATVSRFNEAVRPGTFNHEALDDCRTQGLDAGKKSLGAATRHAAVLGLSPTAGHHIHLSRVAR